jgi:hypothetical protein
MSSHHFVREGQEPALLVLEATSYSDAEGMLEWAPLVVVSEDALQDVLLWGIKIDVVICRPQNEGNLTLELADQAPIRIFSAGLDLAESSLLFLSGSGQNAVSVMVKELSDDLRTKIERFASKTQVTVRMPGQKCSFIPSGNYKKWYQSGAILEFSDGAMPGKLKAVSLSLSRFELTDDQWISIENSAPFWIAEDL